MKVVVVGAGYAGTIAANRLAKKVPDAEITVVNPREDSAARAAFRNGYGGNAARLDAARWDRHPGWSGRQDR